MNMTDQREQIEAAIPHRAPMLLVDEIVSQTADEIVCRKHFRDDEAYKQSPVPELSRLYRLVNQIADYHITLARLPEVEQQLQQHQQWLEEKQAAPLPEEKGQLKKAKKELKKLLRKLQKL